MGKRFRLKTIKGGRKQVVETDSPADYLRLCLQAFASDFAVGCDVAVGEMADGWLRVRVELPAAGAVGEREGWGPGGLAALAQVLSQAEVLRFAEFMDELGHVFKSFYECGRCDRPAGNLRIWEVRHRKGCPWV